MDAWRARGGRSGGSRGSSVTITKLVVAVSLGLAEAGGGGGGCDGPWQPRRGAQTEGEEGGGGGRGMTRAAGAEAGGGRGGDSLRGHGGGRLVGIRMEMGRQNHPPVLVCGKV
jgi:hypothetical protein